MKNSEVFNEMIDDLRSGNKIGEHFGGHLYQFMRIDGWDCILEDGLITHTYMPMSNGGERIAYFHKRSGDDWCRIYKIDRAELIAGLLYGDITPL